MGKSYNRRHVLKAAGTVSLAGLAGCITGGDDSGGGDGGETTIEMGILMALTGDLSNVGQPIRDGAMLAVDRVNEADNGVTVDVQEEDTGTDPDQGVDRAEALLNDDYPMVCGALASSVSLAVLENVAVPNEMLMCSPASTSPEFTDYPDEGFFFRTPPTDALQGEVLATVASDQLGNDTASVLSLDDTYGRGLSNGFVSAYESDHAGTVHTTEFFEGGRENYVPELETVLADEPETLLLIAFPETGANILNDFYAEFDTGLDILVPDGLRSEDLPQSVDTDLTNVTGTSPAVAGPGLDFFTDRYQEVYDREPGVFNEQAYDAAAALMLAQARADPPTGRNISNNMWWNTDEGGETFAAENLGEAVEAAASGSIVHYQGVSGPVNFDANGDLGSAIYDYFEYTADGGIRDTDQLEA